MDFMDYSPLSPRPHTRWVTRWVLSKDMTFFSPTAIYSP